MLVVPRAALLPPLDFVWRFLSTEVLRHWAGGNHNGKKLTKDTKGNVEKNLARLWQRRRGREKKKPVKIKQPRLSNKHVLLATDNFLQGFLGYKGLAEFRATNPCRPLKAGEKRVYVDVDQLPAKIQAMSKNRKRRAAIQSVNTDHVRLEVFWGQPRPSLHEVTDMGTIGWNSKPACYDAERGALRGTFECDPHHRRHNNCLQALNSVGLGWAKCEVMLAHTMVHGPFDSSAWFTSMKEGREEYEANFSIDCPLFQHFYPRLHLSMNGGKYRQLWHAC